MKFQKYFAASYILKLQRKIKYLKNDNNNQDEWKELMKINRMFNV